MGIFLIALFCGLFVYGIIKMLGNAIFPAEKGLATFREEPKPNKYKAMHNIFEEEAIQNDKDYAEYKADCEKRGVPIILKKEKHYFNYEVSEKYYFDKDNNVLFDKDIFSKN